MNKKLLLAVCALTAAAAMTVGLAACDPGESSGLSASEAATKIAGFTTTPTTIDATFKQTYTMTTTSDNASVKAFERDIDDTVIIQADFTAGSVYYYGKKTDKDGSVTEQLVSKDSDGYYYMTTTTVKTALSDETAAVAMIDELMYALSYETSGYVDSSAFVYGTSWVKTYLLLNSSALTGTESQYFTYTYDETDDGGLQVNIDMGYVGYFSDSGILDFSTDDTHTGATAAITTDSNGYITSFSQTLNNHTVMAITSEGWPLDYVGTRSISANYSHDIDRVSGITQNLTPSTITVNAVEHATVATYDFEKDNYATLATTSTTVSAGNYVAVKVTCEEGYEVSSVTVNGYETTNINGYYCYMTPAEADTTYVVNVVVVEEGTEAVGYIVCEDVEGATIVIADFNLSDYSVTPSTTVAIGHFLAVGVTLDTGYELVSVVVNDGTEEKDITTATYGSDYCCLSISKAGTYTVTVTVKKTPATIVCNTVENATVEIADFNLSDYSVTPGTTVEIGHFLAVKVTPDDGYKLVSVVVSNGTEEKDITTATYGSAYCCYAISATGTYTVTITVEAEG